MPNIREEIKKRLFGHPDLGVDHTTKDPLDSEKLGLVGVIYFCGHTGKGTGVDDHSVVSPTSRYYVHSPTGKWLDRTGDPYDPEKHGTICQWVEEGEQVPNMDKSRDGKTAIHWHNGRNSNGSIEYNWE